VKGAVQSRGKAESPCVEELMIRAAEGRPARLARLDDALSAFAEGLGAALAGVTGGEVASSLGAVDYVSCDEARLRATGVLASAEARPWTGAFFVGIEMPLILALLGRILGDETDEASSDRTLTPIERRLALRLLDRAVCALSADLAGLRKIAGRAVDLRDELTEFDLGAAGDRCVVATVHLEAGEAMGDLRVLMPFSLFGTDLDMLSRPRAVRTGPEASGWREELSQMIASANVTVTAILGGGAVRLGDALAWTPGTTLDLSLDPSQTAQVACSGRTIFRGAAGRRANGALALQITEDVDTKEASDR
jgi:flagellar motor switch protein FliM